MKVYEYKERNDYDTNFYKNGSEVKILSKKTFKHLNINKENIVGEIGGCHKNKYFKHEYIYFKSRKCKVYELGSGNKGINKTKGYIEVDNGKYLKVLKKTYLFVILLCILITLGCVQLYQMKVNSETRIDRSVKSNIVYVEGCIYQNNQLIENAHIELMDEGKVIQTTISDKEGLYLLTKLDKKDYYLRITYKDIVTYRYLHLDHIENRFDINLPPYPIKEEINTNLHYVFVDDIESVIKTVNKDSIYQIKVDILDIDEHYLDNSIGFYVDLKLEEYIDGVLVSTKTLDELDSDIKVVVLGFGYYDLLSVYQYKNEELLDVENYHLIDDLAILTIHESGTYILEIQEKDFSTKGSSSITYSNDAYLDINTNRLTYTFHQTMDSTNKTRIEVYLYSNNELIQVGKSQVYDIGNESKSIVINKKLDKGIYDGLIRIYYLDKDTLEDIVDVDIPITIIANE